MRLARFVLARLMQLIPTLWLISLFVFLLAHIAPGDPVTAMAGPFASQELIDQIKTQYDLDKPLPVQYVLWLGKVVRGNLGYSIITHQSVARMIWERAGTTVTLAVFTTAFYCLVALPVGVVSARHRGGWLDRVAMAFSGLAISLPNFYTAMVLIVLLGVVWRILPVAGWASLTLDPLESVRHLVMPTVSLGLIYIALLARLVRSEMLDTLQEDFIRTARGKGLPELIVLFKHAFRNAMLPAINLISLNFASLLGGTVLIEEIFAIPGLGRLVVKAVLQRDFPVLQGVTLVIGLVFILSSVFADFLGFLADPRLSAGRARGEGR